MKRIGNVYDKICSIENLQMADEIAQQGKRKQYGVIVHNRNKDANIQRLREALINKTYKTSRYKIFTIYEPKERKIYSLPFFPDRIVHHAVMLHLERMFTANFTADTYSCIKGKGVHAALRAVRRALKNVEGTTYCMKLDIRKFYPSIDHEILKALLRRKIKDRELLSLLDEIIESADGLPIGNYLSQYFANFYLSGFDHWLKEEKKVKSYFRYADDLVFLNSNTEDLHDLLVDIKQYLSENLKLDIKDNHQVFPVAARGIDFVGYRIYHTHTLLRKRIKKSFARAVAKNKGMASIAAYKGWAKHANTRHLIKKLLPYEKL